MRGLGRQQLPRYVSREMKLIPFIFFAQLLQTSAVAAHARWVCCKQSRGNWKRVLRESTAASLWRCAAADNDDGILTKQASSVLTSGRWRFDETLFHCDEKIGWNFLWLLYQNCCELRNYLIILRRLRSEWYVWNGRGQTATILGELRLCYRTWTWTWTERYAPCQKVEVVKINVMMVTMNCRHHYSIWSICLLTGNAWQRDFISSHKTASYCKIKTKKHSWVPEDHEENTRKRQLNLLRPVYSDPTRLDCSRAQQCRCDSTRPDLKSGHVVSDRVGSLNCNHFWNHFPLKSLRQHEEVITILIIIITAPNQSHTFRRGICKPE